MGGPALGEELRVEILVDGLAGTYDGQVGDGDRQSGTVMFDPPSVLLSVGMRFVGTSTADLHDCGEGVIPAGLVFEASYYNLDIGHGVFM